MPDRGSKINTQTLFLLVAVISFFCLQAAAIGRPASTRKRVLVYYDMEGLAGQSDWRTVVFREKEYYLQGQEYLIADVNAVVAGLCDGGASVIDVVDMHGSGNPDPDLPPERLDPRARSLSQDRPFDPLMDLARADRYDAIVLVGMHTKSGTNGFLAHTFEAGLSINLNGRWITETEFLAYAWGNVDVPVIFVSGDDMLGDDLKPVMPWLRYVVVKHSTGVASAQILPVEQVHDKMRQMARLAVENTDRAQMMKLKTPISIVVKASPPITMASLEDLPGINYKDESVFWTANDVQTALKGILALDDFASASFEQFMLKQMKTSRDYNNLRRKAIEEFFAVDVQVEKGDWTPPLPKQPQPAKDGRYYGAQ